MPLGVWFQFPDSYTQNLNMLWPCVHCVVYCWDAHFKRIPSCWFKITILVAQFNYCRSLLHFILRTISFAKIRRKKNSAYGHWNVQMACYFYVINCWGNCLMLIPFVQLEYEIKATVNGVQIWRWINNQTDFLLPCFNMKYNLHPIKNGLFISILQSSVSN